MWRKDRRRSNCRFRGAQKSFVLHFRIQIHLGFKHHPLPRHPRAFSSMTRTSSYSGRTPCALFIQCMKFLELTKDSRVLNCNLNMAVLSSLWLTSWNRPRPSSRHPHLSRSCTRSRVPSNLSCSKARMIMPNALFSVSTGIIPLKSLTPLSMRAALLCVVLRWTYLLLVQHPLYVRFETFYPGHHSLSYPVHATLMSILLPWEKYLS